MRDYGSEESLIKPKHANMGKMRNTETLIVKNEIAIMYMKILRYFSGS